VNVRIDRLRLQAYGMSPEAAREFGRLVAERLGVLLEAAPPAPGTGRLAGRHVQVSWPAGEAPGSHAAAAAAEIARALRGQAAGTEAAR